VEHVANAMVIGGNPAFEAGDDYEHVNYSNGRTYHRYQSNYCYNVVLALHYPLNNDHMYYTSSHHVVCANNVLRTVR
jgi:hypothetical protein